MTQTIWLYKNYIAQITYRQRYLSNSTIRSKNNLQTFYTNLIGGISPPIFFVIYTIAFLRFYRISFFHTLIIITHSILIINMPNSKTDNEILMIRINERKNGMKKTVAILASIAAMSLCGLSASAADGDNIIDGVLNGAEEIVDGVVSGAEEIITPGGSTSVDESTNDSTAIPDTVSQVTPSDSTSSTGNVNTGVPAFELAALGAAAVGGLAAMAITVRKNNK